MKKIINKLCDKLHIEHWQIISLMLIIYDIFTINCAFFLPLWFRFDCQYSMIPEEYLNTFIAFAPI